MTDAAVPWPGHAVDSPSPCRRVRRGPAGADRRCGAATRRRPRALVLGDVWLVAITAAVTLPILWLGYGTDLDIGFVLDAGARIRDFDYVPSRNPGVPVVEAIVAVLDPVGGHVLVNLATVAVLAATVVAVAGQLVTAWGHDNGDLVALAFLASPIVVISGTQTADFVWAVAFLSWGALAARAPAPGRGRACCWRCRSAAAVRRCCSWRRCWWPSAGTGTSGAGSRPQPRWRPLSPCCCM